MNLLCPQCCSEDNALTDRGTRLECGNCGAVFQREEALVTVADAKAHVEERPRHLPEGRQLGDAEALDLFAAKLNEPGECNGGDLVELVSTLLLRTGRRVEDEPDDEGVWS